MQVTKDYRLARVSGPLTYNDIATASSEGSKDIWTDRERDWDEAEAIDTGQNRIVGLFFDWLGINPTRCRSHLTLNIYLFILCFSCLIKQINLPKCVRVRMTPLLFPIFFFMISTIPH